MLHFNDGSFYGGVRPTTARLNEQDRRVASALSQITDENLSRAAAVRANLLEDSDGDLLLQTPTVDLEGVAAYKAQQTTIAAGSFVRFTVERLRDTPDNRIVAFLRQGDVNIAATLTLNEDDHYEETTTFLFNPVAGSTISILMRIEADAVGVFAQCATASVRFTQPLVAP